MKKFVIIRKSHIFHSSSIYAQYKVFELAGANIMSKYCWMGKVQMKHFWQVIINTFIGICNSLLISKSRFLMPAIKGKKALQNNKIPFQWSIKNMIATYFPAHVAILLEKKAYRKTINHPDIDENFLASFRGKEWEGIHKPIVAKLNDILYFNTMQFGLGRALLRFADRNSMAHGCEVRLPFLSHELVEFIFLHSRQILKYMTAGQNGCCAKQWTNNYRMRLYGEKTKLVMNLHNNNG